MGDITEIKRRLALVRTKAWNDTILLTDKEEIYCQRAWVLPGNTTGFFELVGRAKRADGETNPLVQFVLHVMDVKRTFH